jgi:hypothetical protein
MELFFDPNAPIAVRVNCSDPVKLTGVIFGYSVMIKRIDPDASDLGRKGLFIEHVTWRLWVYDKVTTKNTITGKDLFFVGCATLESGIFS